MLFRDLLLPRMRAFATATGFSTESLIPVYHLHMPWAIPTVLVDTFALSYPSRRYRSALIGIAVHSVQSVVIIAPHPGPGAAVGPRTVGWFACA